MMKSVAVNLWLKREKGVAPVSKRPSLRFSRGSWSADADMAPLEGHFRLATREFKGQSPKKKTVG
jgi:hypothetical protein